MEIAPQLLVGGVSHKRLIPVKNAFNYGIYYLALPINTIDSLSKGIIFGFNRFGLLAFFEKDHIEEKYQSLEQFKSDILNEFGITKANGETILVTMPRVLGYIFNPVCFWLCLDDNAELRAVICAVSNTYGEKHYYLCAHADQRVIKPKDRLNAEKVFHVSPFIAREGSYEFKFGIENNHVSISINYFNADQQRLLVTSLQGDLIGLNRKRLIYVFFRYPLVTMMAITKIHWQALKLFSRKIKFIDKPEQISKTMTRSIDAKNSK